VQITLCRVWSETVKNEERICKEESASELSVWDREVLFSLLQFRVVMCHNFLNLTHLILLILMHYSALFIMGCFHIIICHLIPGTQILLSVPVLEV
jgi:hypothetical protein